MLYPLEQQIAERSQSIFYQNTKDILNKISLAKFLTFHMFWICLTMFVLRIGAIMWRKDSTHAYGRLNNYRDICLATLKFLYVTMCAHVKQLLYFQIWMTSAMRITPLSSSKYSQQDNSVWKLILVERMIPLKHSHSIYFHFFVIIRYSVLHAWRNEGKKLTVYQYENMHYLPQGNDISQKKYLQLSKLFLFH